MISLDYETKCELDIRRVGLDAYTAHPSFSILMAAYRIDDGPVQHWQAHEGPPPAELVERLLDPHELKWAFNAQFERVCTTRGFGIATPIAGWRCSMVLAYAHSFTRGLADVGEQMCLPADSRKTLTGRRLIQRFCKPQRVTRNQPHVWRDHRTDPVEWAEFCSYNIQDVVAEEGIRDRLISYPMLDSEWDFYGLDQRINDRGMPFDRAFADNVGKMSERRRGELYGSMRSWTGLEKPGSQRELLRWLLTQGYPFLEIGEHSVSRALNMHEAGLVSLTEPCNEVLRLRQWAARTSTTKAQAALRCAGQDDRLRYLYQFGGASRTQRFAGRLVQPQNLARTPKLFDPEKSSERLDVVTELIRQGDYDTIDMLVDEPMSVFGGVMRGMFRVPEGRRLHVCDYSSIESVGLAWIARCQRMLDVFAAGRDIYRDFGSELYRKPYHEITSAERQICKPATLGCLGAETQVLTDSGWKSIIDIGLGDRVFDGVEFVDHAGVVDQGVKSTIGLHGLRITPDHLVLCGDEWCPAAEVMRNTRLGRRAIDLVIGGLSRLSESNVVSCTTDAGASVAVRSKIFTHSIWSTVSRRAASFVLMPGFAKKKMASVYDLACRVERQSGLPIGTMRSCPGVGEWGPLALVTAAGGSFASLQTCTSSLDIVSRYPARMMNAYRLIVSIITNTMSRAISGLLRRKRKPVIKKFFAGLHIAVKQCVRPSSGSGMRPDTVMPARWRGRYERGCLPSKSSPTSETVAVPTYDIARCGSRNRFTVWSAAGPMIVHNCGYGLGPGQVQRDGLMTGLLAYAAGMGIPMRPDQAKEAVKIYRETYAEVPVFWRFCDYAAARALEGEPVEIGPLLFEARKPYLLIRLPSGRYIYYYKPQIDEVEVRTGQFEWNSKLMRMVERTYKKDVLTFMGRNQRNGRWERIAGRGAHLTENIVQALTRDLLKVGLTRLDKAGFNIIGHSHDEIIVESRAGDNWYAWETMREMMIQPIDWLPDFPLGAAGWSGRYYRK